MYNLKGNYNPATVYEDGDCVFGPDGNLYRLNGSAPAGSLVTDVHWHQVRKELKEAAELIMSAVSESGDELKDLISGLEEDIEDIEEDIKDLDERVTALEGGE